MRRLILPSWFVAAFVAVATMGCHWTCSKETYPDDPLFVSKKPIEVKPEKNATHLVQHVEPSAVRGARP